MSANYQPLYVECYSGQRYAVRPLSFIWLGERRSIKQIESEWIGPGERHFKVLATDDERFELVYNEQKDLWEGVQLVS